MSSGSLFHSSGAETAKALEPYMYGLRIKLAGVRRNAEDDRMALEVK